MKYKVGDKFLIEVVSVLKSGYMMSNNTFLEEHRLKDLDIFDCDSNELFNTWVDYGMDKACEYINKLISPPPTGLKLLELEEIFDSTDPTDIIKKFTIKQIVNRIDAYLKAIELEKENIRVGDIVAVHDGNIRFVVTKDDYCGDENKCTLMAFDGSAWKGCEKKICKKTGTRVNFINILGQLKGLGDDKGSIELELDDLY